MNNDKYTFWKLLDYHSIIEIPIIQRDYAQGRIEENKIRDKFLNVLFEKIKDENKTINLDFVYGRIIGDKLIPLDGQQRLTTLFLLHWYLAVKDDRLDDKVTHKLQKFTYETRISSREFCKALSEANIDLNEINSLPLDKQKLSNLIEDKNWFFNSWKKDPTIKSMLIMIDSIHEKFKCTNGLFDKLICDDEKKKAVTFDFLPLNDFNLSDELYIKMNARGKPLTHFENFKSNFVELLDHETATKLDNEWTDLFWNFKGDPKEDGYYYIDNKILSFFTNIIVNFGLVTDDLNNLKDLKEIEIIDIYKDVLKNKNHSKNLVDIIKILDKLSKLNYKDIPLCFSNFIENSTITYWDRAKFYALSMYLLNFDEQIDFESEIYKDWERITKNIIDNFNMDSLEKFQDTLKLIYRMSKNIKGLYKYIASDEFLSPEKEVRGHRTLEFQQKEEKLKATLIVNNNNWKNIIVNAELETKDSYLNGHIGFLVELSNNSIEDFKIIFNKFNSIFKSNDNFSFHRALLTKGDYLLGSMNEWSNRNFCSFNASNQRAKDDNWKQVFHFKREILKKLLDDEETDLENICKEFTNINDWRYGFIKYPDILKYCGRFQIRMKSQQEILLLSRERTSGYHAEYYSYLLFLELQESKKFSNMEYKFQNSVDLEKYISINKDQIKISFIFHNDEWKYKTEINDKVEYFLDKNNLIEVLLKVEL